MRYRGRAASGRHLDPTSLLPLLLGVGAPHDTPQSREPFGHGALVSGPRLAGMDQLGFDSHPLDDAPLPQRVNPVSG